MSKTAVIGAAIAVALGSVATALAGPGGHGGGIGGGMGLGGGSNLSRGMALGSGGGMGPGAGAMGVAHGPMGGPGPGSMSHSLAAPGTFNRAGPMANAPTFNRGMVAGPTGKTYPGGGNWAYNNWHHGDHDHHHHHHHHNAFFAFGFDGGPYYDYAYNSCWAQVPTYYGLQWVYVCGDYYGYY